MWSKPASTTTHSNPSEEDLLIRFVTVLASVPKDKHGLCVTKVSCGVPGRMVVKQKESLIG